MIKRTLFVIILLIINHEIHAQQRMDNQWLFKASGGYEFIHNGGNISIGAEHIVGSTNNSVQFNLEYSSLLFKKNPIIKNNNFVFNVNYGYNFFSSNIFIFTYIIGGNLGYSNLNNNTNEIKLLENDYFIYGLRTGIQLEVKLASKLNLLLEPSVNYYLQNHNINKFQLTTNVGIKKYF